MCRYSWQNFQINLVGGCSWKTYIPSLYIFIIIFFILWYFFFRVPNLFIGEIIVWESSLMQRRLMHEVNWRRYYNVVVIVSLLVCVPLFSLPLEFMYIIQPCCCFFFRLRVWGWNAEVYLRFGRMNRLVKTYQLTNENDQGPGV